METNTKEKYVVRGELALLIVVIINSLGVVLMLHSGSGISAISSVPYAFAKVLPFLTQMCIRDSTGKNASRAFTG